MTWGIMEELFFSPLFLFVVPCGTFLNYDEDVDILVELALSLFNLNRLGFNVLHYFFLF